jgi:hypothetical protein
VLIGSQIVVALQSIVTREISPIEPASLAVGCYRCVGEAHCFPKGQIA